MSFNLGSEIRARQSSAVPVPDSARVENDAEPAIRPEQFLTSGEFASKARIPEDEFRDLLKYDWDQTGRGSPEKKTSKKNRSDRVLLTKTQQTVLRDASIRLLLVPYSAENILEASQKYLGVNRELMQEIINEAFEQVELESRYTKSQVRSVIENGLMKVVRDGEVKNTDLLKVLDKMVTLWGIKPDQTTEEDLETAIAHMDDIDSTQDIEKLAKMRADMRKELDTRRLALLRAKR